LRGRSIRRSQHHQLRHRYGQKSFERADKIGLESNARFRRQSIIEMVGVPLIQNLNRHAALTIDPPGCRDHLACERDIHRLMPNMPTANHVVDQRAVVIDLKRVETEYAVDFAKRPRRPGRGQHDMDPTGDRRSDRIADGPGHVLIRPQQRAIDINRDQPNGFRRRNNAVIGDVGSSRRHSVSSGRPENFAPASRHHSKPSLHDHPLGIDRS